MPKSWRQHPSMKWTCIVHLAFFLLDLTNFFLTVGTRNVVAHHLSTDKYVCSALIWQGSMPYSPTSTISIWALELFCLTHHRCPHVTVNSFVKTLCDIHWLPFKPYLLRQFSIAFDLYLSIRTAVDRQVQVSLDHDDPAVVATMLFQMGLGHPRDPLWFNSGHDRNDFFHFFQSMGGGFFSFLWKCGPSHFIHFIYFFEDKGALNSFISFISFISLRVWGPSILSILSIFLFLSFLSFLWGCGDPQFIYFFHFFEGVGNLNSFISFISLWVQEPSILSNLSNLSFLWG